MEDMVLKSSLRPIQISNKSIENVTDFKIANNNVRSNELLFKLEKSKALPTLNAFINGTYTGNNNRFDFLNNSQKWFGASILGVNMSIPLFSSFGRSASTEN